VVTSSNNKRMVEGLRQPGLQASTAPESGEREEQDDTSESNPLPNETTATIIDLVAHESVFQHNASHDQRQASDMVRLCGERVGNVSVGCKGDIQDD